MLDTGMAPNDTHITDSEIRQFQDSIKENSPYNFDHYSLNSLKRRALKIMEDYSVDMNNLIRTIKDDPLALEEVVKKITVNTTELFRDPPVWQDIMLKLLPRFRDHSSINVWHPGCSSGQEVYSMMILLDQLRLLEKSNIYASDLNEDNLKAAKKGTYRLRFNRNYIDNYHQVFSSGLNGSDTGEYAPHEKYFTVNETTNRISIKESLLEKPFWKKIDLVNNREPFQTNFDIIVCRNVIIYFNYELQNRILHDFHKQTNNNGALVLGLHESIIGQGSKLYRKEEHFYIKKTS
jgi:chemotaxis protein methyltransferase CheR